MRKMQITVVLGMLLGAGGSEVQAGPVRWSVGINVGAPFYGPYCYRPYPCGYYYRPYPLVIGTGVVLQPAPVVVQQPVLVQAVPAVQLPPQPVVVPSAPPPPAGVLRSSGTS